MDFPIKNDYISYKDLRILQKIVGTIFDNFNGGFGCSDREYDLHQPVDMGWSPFSFKIETPNSNDIAMHTWPPNKLSIDDYTPYVKSVKYHTFEVLYEVCKIYGIEFTPDKACIYKCNDKFQETYVEEISDHKCKFSRAIVQPYPRLCVICGKREKYV